MKILQLALLHPAKPWHEGLVENGSQISRLCGVPLGKPGGHATWLDLSCGFAT